MNTFDPSTGRLRGHVAGLSAAPMQRSWHILDAGLHPARAIRKPHNHYPTDRCREQHPGYANPCDRQTGHTGRHASYGPTLVLAVWA